MEDFGKIKSKEILSINPNTGLSRDYYSSLAGLVGFFDMGGIDSVKDMVKKYPFHMKKYEELYSGYTNLVVDDKNRESIKKLDELSVRMNEILKDPNSIDEDAFRKTCNEIFFLINGDDSLKI